MDKIEKIKKEIESEKGMVDYYNRYVASHKLKLEALTAFLSSEIKVLEYTTVLVGE